MGNRPKDLGFNMKAIGPLRDFKKRNEETGFTHGIDCNNGSMANSFKKMETS